MLTITVFFFVLIELVGVSYIDFTQKKVHNVWPILNIFVYMVLLFVIPTDYKFNIQTLLIPVAFLVLGFFLFKMKIMGGGDSKFLFSFFLLIPVAKHEEVLLYLVYVTVLVASALLAVNTVRNIKAITFAAFIGGIKEVKKFYGKKFVYAPLILIAWVCFGWINRKNIF